MKADDKVFYDGTGETMKFTNFEELQKRVEVLQETLEEVTQILRVNNLKRTEDIVADFDEDEVYKRLNEDRD